MRPFIPGGSSRAPRNPAYAFGDGRMIASREASTGESAVADHVQDDRAVGTPRLGLRHLRQVQLLEQPRPADADLVAGDACRHPDRGRGGEAGRRVQPRSLVGGVAHDRLGEGVLAVGLG